MHTIIGLKSKLSDAAEGRPVNNRRTDGVGLNLFGSFNVGKHLVEGWGQGGLEQVKKVLGEIMRDVITVLVGGRLEQSHCSVDKANNGVNVFTCMILDVQVSNLEEKQIQSM